MESSVFVLVGSEPVRRRHLLGRLRARAGDWEQLSAAVTDPLGVLQPSLLAGPEHPLVRVLRDYAKWTAAQRKQFAAALADMPDGVQVVVLCDRLGDKDPLRGAVAGNAVVSLEQPRPGQFAAWVMRQAKLAGARIDAPVAETLVARVGESTEALASELDKLAAASGGEISEALLAALTPATTQAKAWTFSDGLLADDRRAAMAALATCEQAGEQPLALTGALHGRLLTLAWVHAGVSAEQAQVKPYPWKLAQQAARGGWPAGRVRRALMQLVALEAGLRGDSTLPAWTQLAAFAARPLGA